MKKDSGYIFLIYIVVIAALIVASLVAYSKFVPDEAHQTKYARAECQAWFLAQQAIIDKGLEYFEKNDPSSNAFERMTFPGYKTKDVGECKNIVISKIHGVGGQNAFENTMYYNIRATGIGYFDNSFGKKCPVERSSNLTIKMAYFSDYLYLTDIETTIYREIVWFWGPGRDTLIGRVHSNDFIGIKGRPVFLGPVSSCKKEFIHGQGYDPDFKYIPALGVPRVLIPTTAQSVREHANPFISDNDGYYMTHLEFRGAAGVYIYQYPIGAMPTNDNIVNIKTFGPPNNQAIFVDGQLEISGILAGRCTVGSSGNMWLIDNIKYNQTNNQNGMGNNAVTDMLGLVSEKNIIIKDNDVNGKNNSTQGRDIIINAAILALDESFTFEHQNDDWEAYQGTTPDERGVIYLWGSVSQKRRG